jgi:hypothetical protein
MQQWLVRRAWRNTDIQPRERDQQPRISGAKHWGRTEPVSAWTKNRVSTRSCCAGATTGHAAATPITLRNSRRLIPRAPHSGDGILTIKFSVTYGVARVCARSFLRESQSPLWVTSGSCREPACQLTTLRRLTPRVPRVRFFTTSLIACSPIDFHQLAFVAGSNDPYDPYAFSPRRLRMPNTQIVRRRLLPAAL